MSLPNAQAQLQTVLEVNTALIAWAQTHFNREWTELKANRPVKILRPDEMPLRVYELDVGDTGPEVMNQSQTVVTSISVAVGWHEQDYATAFDQRTALIDLMIKAVMANSTLNDSVAGAWVSKFIPDQSVNHPKHFVTFEVAIEYTVNNT